MLFGFVGGDNARAYNAMSPAARRNAVVNQYADLFGSQAAKPTAFFDTNWSDEMWTRGCPVGIPSLGTLLSYGPEIRQPVGPDPLGRHRDLDLLERLHGRGRALG